MNAAHVRLVVDTNVLISAFIGGRLARLFAALEDKDTELFISREQLTELIDVVERPKFRKYFSLEEARAAIGDLCMVALFPENGLPVVNVCRDAKDDHLLALSKATDADVLITGDEDLLVLEKFEKTEIISPATFMRRWTGRPGQ